MSAEGKATVGRPAAAIASGAQATSERGLLKLLMTIRFNPPDFSLRYPVAQRDGPDPP